MSKNCTNFLLFLFSTLTGLILCELVLKTFEPIRHSFYPKGLFEKDTKFGHKLSKNFKGIHSFQDYSYKVNTNSVGCFEEEIALDKAEVLVIGDSHTWGYVQMADRFSNKLRSKYNLNSYNCALTASGTLQQKHIYEKLF